MTTLPKNLLNARMDTLYRLREETSYIDYLICNMLKASALSLMFFLFRNNGSLSF